MARPRRDPAATVRNLVRTVQDALLSDIAPPPHVNLRPDDLPFWRDIMRARARSEWSDADLIHAANLARCQADIQRLSAELQAEPTLVRNAAGSMVPNPKNRIVDMLTKRSMALSRLLQLQALARGRAEDKVRARQLERSARQIAAELDDELVPKG